MTPTSATGRSSNALPCAGFSLLEILVVIFIVGVLATMFTLSIGVTGDDRQLETELDRMIAVVDLAREEAVIQGHEIGMRIFSDGYEFAAFYEDFVEYHDEDTPDQSRWVMLERETLLGPRELPAGMLFELQIDGRDVVLQRAGEAEKTAGTGEPDKTDPLERYRPQVMIFSSGDMDPFTIRLRREFANSGPTIEFGIDGGTEIDWGER